jgi:hypothetical protein
MRTIQTPDLNVFTFDELSTESQEVAINKVRDSYYQFNEFNEWAKDDCFLLNPPYKELEKTKFKHDVLIKNTRIIYFSFERDRFIDISNAMEIVSNDVFLKWLGITDRMIDQELVCFEIGKDTIEFEENHYDKEFTDRDLRILERAKDKFENHCSNILKSLEESYNYRFTDEAIKEDIAANEMEFTEDGDKYQLR